MSDPVELLKTFKASATKSPSHSVLLIADDEVALALLAAWPHVPVELKKGTKKVAVPEIVQWDWLWTQWAFSPERWMILAGVSSRPSTLKVIERLKGAKLIFPDGTLAPHAENFLTKLATDAVPGQVRKMLSLLKSQQKAQKPVTASAAAAEDDD